ncbi:MAG TPA: hypothetical protein VK158_06270, partial [Acidobacteriota bacterium]|nr:hypothetical protein [Acidobacteriota bacterium]
MKRVWIVVVFSLLLVICISTLYAAEIPITVDINSEPEITSITLTDADGGNVQLNGLDTRIMTCFGTLRDNDSYLDITSFNATFFGQNSTLTAANSAGTHYTNTSCATSGGSGATVNFQCNVTIHHH